eukprot:CAMPEP_0174707512 /NCGR_PEP_ID=MMETSP1094-20130205/10009_1 /TAXON_ID=156173 /ORGANISM="Chrysochromulina brevifilum, Strain UTEX LB 985" /LENGTH=78 /DNA_ID=CAMNT_0015905905 /DNA_START=225 /DNA_END=461 /DNA_ORIENTATION=-
MPVACRPMVAANCASVTSAIDPATEGLVMTFLRMRALSSSVHRRTSPSGVLWDATSSQDLWFVTMRKASSFCPLASCV